MFLVCEGIDTISNIYLNDVLVGTTDMFVRYKFDIKYLLTENQNKIKIVFEPFWLTKSNNYCNCINY